MGLTASVPAAGKPTPQLSVSLRGIEGQTLEQGEPWRVVVRLDLPRGSKESLALAPDAGTWADAIAVELYPATGDAAAARAEAVGKPDVPQATLDANRMASGLWRFSPEAMQSVAPGRYVLRVRLALVGGTGWTGVVAAREIPIAVVTSSTPHSIQHVLNRGQDLLLLGQVQAAAAAVDAGLRTSPRDDSLLKVRAQIAERAGNPLAAILCLNAASFSPGSKKVLGLPPPEEIELRERFEKSRRATVASTPPAPAWSWPPREVLLALSQEARNSGLIPAMPPDGAAGARGETAPAQAHQTPPAAAASGVPTVSVSGNGVIVPSAELPDAQVIADLAGQWAVAATASSQYGQPKYSPAQATGAPNIPLGMAGDNPDAWCPLNKNNGMEWLEVGFAKPAQATEVRVRQNNAPGAIVKIEAIESDGTVHVWWEGVDPLVAPTVREIVWFAVRVPQTSYAVAKVKITLNLATVPGWKQIDAVQLVGPAP